MYFETKVKHENIDGKLVTELYLVDALTCTEAEARITSELSSLYNDLEVVSVKQSKLSEIVLTTDPEAEWYYLVKVAFTAIYERTAQEKKTISAILVQAASFNDAKNKFGAFMHDSMADWEYVSIALTPIIDVYRYEPATDTAE